MEERFACRMTFDLSNLHGVDAKLNYINKLLEAPQVSFEKFVPYIEEKVGSIQDSAFALSLEDPFDDFFDFQVIVADLISNNKIDELYEHSSEPLDQLKRSLNELLSPEFTSILTKMFPLDPVRVFEQYPEMKSSFAAIASLVRENTMNNGFIEWIGQELTPTEWHNNTSYEGRHFKKCGIYEKHKTVIRSNDPNWALVTPDNIFKLIKVDNGQEIMKFHVDHIDRSRSGNSVRVWSDKNTIGVRLITADRSLKESWLMKEPPMPLFLPYFNSHAPKELFDSFYQALISPDTYVLRAMLHHEVLRMKNAGQSMKDLFTIFSNEGLVHQFLTTVVATEFKQSALTENTILRGNSHLTSLFKVYNELFGQEFYKKILRPIIDRVDEAGNLGIKEQKTENITLVYELLNFAIDTFLSGQKYISPQFRHMASVLKTMTITLLRTKHAVFNALSNFVCLRYTTAIVTNPAEFDRDGKQTKDMTGISVPFAQLLQIPFNLQPLTERYGYLGDFNEKIIDRYEEIYNFVIAVADINEKVEYPKPSKEELHKAIERLLKNISETKEAFLRRFKDFSENDFANHASFAISDLISKLYQ